MTKQTLNLLNDYHLLAYDTLDSTNDEAKRLAKNGAAHGAVVWAKKQTAGRGRYGRPWVSEEGNLFASMLLAPSCDAGALPQLSFVAGIAAQEALAPLLPDKKVSCKWPNDILVDGKKFAGILLESFEYEGRRWVIIGFGVNVNSHPDEVMFPATSLCEEGVEIISAKIVLSRFIHHFIEWYNRWEKKGFASVRRAWMKCAWQLGQPMQAKLPNEEVEGIFREIDKTGALVLLTAPRKRRFIHAADVFPLEKPLPPDGSDESANLI